MDTWYHFSVFVDRAGHVKLRQVHVRPRAHSATGSPGYALETWSKGLSGKLWHVRETGWFSTFDRAVENARDYITRWCREYVTVDEGEPPRVKRNTASPAGAADPDWWADVLGVSPTASQGDAKRAFRRRAMETHPDRGGDADEFKRVYAAYEFAKQQGGWK